MSDPKKNFRYANKFSVCVSDIGPLYDKKRNLLTSDKLEICTILLKQFNSVCTMPLPNKQVTDPESFFSVKSITSQDQNRPHSYSSGTEREKLLFMFGKF